jgi:hypothetical protein
VLIGAAYWWGRDADVFATPTIQVTTDPAGARVFLDDADQGISPATVDVPDDGAPHTLCVYKKELEACRELKAGTLSSDYHFDAD